MPPSTASDARTAAVNRLCEFLVIATHAILHQHSVYPQRMFELRRAYGVATNYSKHPTVNSYITRVVTSLRAWALSGTLRSVTLPVFEPSSGRVHARYVFELSVPARAGETSTAAALAALDAQLRAHLCRLLAEPPRVRGEAELSFDFVVRTTGVRVGAEWVPADGGERREFERGAEALPLKDADAFADTVQICSRVEYPAPEAV